MTGDEPVTCELKFEPVTCELKFIEVHGGRGGPFRVATCTHPDHDWGIFAHFIEWEVYPGSSMSGPPRPDPEADQ